MAFKLRIHPRNPASSEIPQQNTHTMRATSRTAARMRQRVNMVFSLSSKGPEVGVPWPGLRWSEQIQDGLGGDEVLADAAAETAIRAGAVHGLSPQNQDLAELAIV